MPAAPGIVCAQGLVVSDLKEVFVVGRRTLLDSASREPVAEVVGELLGQAGAWFGAERVPAERQALELGFDLRYVGQNFELSVPIMTGASLATDSLPAHDELRERFFRVHETAYGYFNSRDPVEIINFRLTARGRLNRLARVAGAASTARAAESRTSRDIWFSENGAVPSRVFERGDLLPGHVLEGPAVVEQLDTTTLIYPGDRATVDGAGNLIIEVAGGASTGAEPA